ncbi:prepilin-type N-terminal cleavage/methylation domain-containing protein [Neobacillus mesonae]|uniref:type IV pilus modification PilV family protein n=1 Tax=Neobacillus mesonae TaxID=1193713 RepID=UPI002E22161A|nr:prepilin-type N-terminal cleavage/methylation domain-containing protein [Neobacillus mesonae]
MRISKNENGLTLIEVLVSIVILSMILLTTMSFFPQMGKINNLNTTKTQAINTAKDILLQWQKKTDDNTMDSFFANPDAGIIPEYNPINGKDYYNFESVDGNFFINIQIKKAPSKESNIYNAHQINVFVYTLNKRDVAISKTYGYIKVRR